MFSDYLERKYHFKTYYYNESLSENLDIKPIIEQLSGENFAKKQLTDNAWIFYVGFIIPFVLFLIMLPLYLKGYFPIYLFIPLFLWISNSYYVYYRKKFNNYNELSEISSQYNHRYIPLIISCNVIICILLFVIILFMVDLSSNEELPFILLLIILLIINVFIIYLDKFNEYLSTDLRSDKQFKRLYRYILVIVFSILAILVIYYFTIKGFDFTFQSYINHHSMQELYENDFL